MQTQACLTIWQHFPHPLATGALSTAGSGGAPLLSAVPFIWPTFVARASKASAHAPPTASIAPPSFIAEFEAEVREQQAASQPVPQKQQVTKQSVAAGASAVGVDAAAIVREVTCNVLGSSIHEEEPLMSGERAGMGNGHGCSQCLPSLLLVLALCFASLRLLKFWPFLFSLTLHCTNCTPQPAWTPWERWSCATAWR